MPDTDGPDSFAAVLRAIKDRTGDSYETLARRAGVSSSTLHRYCSGRTLPVEVGVVERLGRACDATRDDVIALHHAWAATAAARGTGADPPVPAAAPGPRAERAAPAAAPAAVPAAPPATPERTAAPECLAVRVEPAFGQIWTRSVAVAGTAAARVWTVVRAAGRRPSPYALAAEPAVALRNWAVLLLVAVLGLVGGAWRPGGHPAGAHELPDPTKPRTLLMEPGCQGSLGLSRRDECVAEVQRLLQYAGARLDVDGDFGETTRRRVLAFQRLAHLSTTGVVDGATKTALYEGKVRMNSWADYQVEDWIRQMFPGDEDRAVHLARCMSGLDPMWASLNPSGWGAFGLTDEMVRRAGHPVDDTVLDPAANIRIARDLWRADHGFRAWKTCQLPVPVSTDRGQPV
jgi:transcriptional regulator with XRE-family HTH domain